MKSMQAIFPKDGGFVGELPLGFPAHPDHFGFSIPVRIPNSISSGDNGRISFGGARAGVGVATGFGGRPRRERPPCKFVCPIARPAASLCCFYCGDPSRRLWPSRLDAETAMRGQRPFLGSPSLPNAGGRIHGLPAVRAHAAHGRNRRAGLPAIL
jgi:hypothetical protein